MVRVMILAFIQTSKILKQYHYIQMNYTLYLLV